MTAGTGDAAPVRSCLPASGRGGWMALRRGCLASITNPEATAFPGSILVITLPVGAPPWVSPLRACSPSSRRSGITASRRCFPIGGVRAGYQRAKAVIGAVIGTVLLAFGIHLTAFP